MQIKRKIDWDEMSQNFKSYLNDEIVRSYFLLLLSFSAFPNDYSKCILSLKIQSCVFGFVLKEWYLERQRVRRNSEEKLQKVRSYYLAMSCKISCKLFCAYPCNYTTYPMPLQRRPEF